MDQETYVIAEIAAMTGLSTRTIRSYLSCGQLMGEKVEGTWRFTAEQFADFLSQPMVRQSVQAKANALVCDFLLQEAAPGGCTILDVPVENEAAFRQRLLALVNSGRYGALRFSYRYERGMARVILVGEAGAAARLVVDLDL